MRRDIYMVQQHRVIPHWILHSAVSVVMGNMCKIRFWNLRSGCGVKCQLCGMHITDTNEIGARCGAASHTGLPSPPSVLLIHEYDLIRFFFPSVSFFCRFYALFGRKLFTYILQNITAEICILSVSRNILWLRKFISFIRTFTSDISSRDTAK